MAIHLSKSLKDISVSKGIAFGVTLTQHIIFIHMPLCLCDQVPHPEMHHNKKKAELYLCPRFFVHVDIHRNSVLK